MSKDKHKTYYLKSNSINVESIDLVDAKKILSDPLLYKNYIFDLKKPNYKKTKIINLFDLIKDVFLIADKELGGTGFFDFLFTSLRNDSEYEQEKYIKSFIALYWEDSCKEIYEKYIQPENREEWITNILNKINEKDFILNELIYNQEMAFSYLIKTNTLESILNNKYSYRTYKNGKETHKLDLKTRYMIDIYVSGHTKRKKKIEFLNILTNQYNLKTEYKELVKVISLIGLDSYKINFFNDNILNNIEVDYFLIENDENTKVKTSLINASKFNYMKKNLNLIVYNQVAYDFEGKLYTKRSESENMFESYIKEPFIKENGYVFFDDKSKKAKGKEIKAIWLYFALKALDLGKTKDGGASKGKVIKI